MPLSQVNIDKVKHLHDVDSASSYLFSQIEKTPALQKALDFSIEAHKHQFRKSGEPYIIHPILVASIVASITDDESMAIAALLHDVGKPSTTRPDLTAHGHAKAGTPLAQRFMKRLNPSTQLVDRVMKLVEIHMQPHALLHDNASNPAWHRLHRKFQLDVLLMLAIADGAGRTGHTLEEAIDHVTPAFTVLNGLRKFGAKPLVTGFDLLKRGHKQGEGMGKLLKELFDRQLNGETREELLASI